MNLLGHEIAPLGMGCWPIGGPMYAGDQPLGYANADDAESIRTIHAALDLGLGLFDTAAAYGAGHAERLLARALRNRPEALIVTKVGIAIDEASRQLTGPQIDPAAVMPAIEGCLSRLGRDRIDILLLHQNELPVSQATPIFEEMAKAVQAGKIRSYGWSTDFSRRVAAVAAQDGFVAVEHAMNVLLDAPAMQETVRGAGLHALIRSPLGMGLLTGKYDSRSVMAADDIRSTANPATDYFIGARANPRFLSQLAAIRDLLETGGRTLTQGAIAWLWAKGDQNIPIPGARTVSQIEGIAGAIPQGPLPAAVMEEIEVLLDRGDQTVQDQAR